VHDVFISYSRSDSREFVARLTDALEAAGKDVWVDLDDIPPASRWESDLREGVLQSSSLIYVISPGAVASHYCDGELDHATEHNKRLIPVVHRPVDEGALPPTVGARNWIPPQGTFEDDFDASLKGLLTAIDIDADRLRAHTRWEQRAEEWSERDQAASLLARGSELREAETWIASETGSEPHPTKLQAEFVAASRRAHTRRQRLTLAVALLALVLTAAVAVYAFAQRGKAIDQRDLARSNDLAASALSNLDTDPELSLILAVAAAKASETDRSEQALAQAVAASRVRTRVEPGGDLYMARVSPNGRWLVTGSTEGANLYDARTGELLKTLQSGSDVYDLAFFSDSSAVFTGGKDGVLRSFSLPDGKRTGRFDAHRATSSIALSADDTILAVTTPRGPIKILGGDASTPETLKGHSGSVYTVAFATGGSSLVSASQDGTAIVWDAETGRRLATLSRGEGPAMYDADISADGRTVVTVGADGRAREWDVQTERPVGEPFNDIYREGRAQSIALSPDGETALLALADGSATAYDLATQTPVAAYRGHEGRLFSAEFGARAHDVVTTGVDGTARVWDEGSVVRTLRGSETALTTSFSADGERIGAALSGGYAAIYDTSDGRLVGYFKASREALRAVSFSADRTRVVTAGDDGDARVWDPGSETRIGRPLREGAQILTAVFDRDESHVLTASRDGTARVWDLTDGNNRVVFRAHRRVDYPYAAGYSPDGSEIVVAEGGEDAAGVFDATTLEPLSTLEGEDFVIDSSFDPSSTRVAAGGGSGFGDIWDADTGDRVTRLETQHGQIQSALWSPSGGQVVTASVEGVRIWDANSGLELATIPGESINASISPDELIARTPTATSPVQVLDCEVCTATDSELLSLAESRITREPTADEKHLYGLD
jgi:WD40 repeat protein